jgi:hypothetical protein
MKSLIACFSATLLLAACVTDGPRDAGGRGMQLTEAKEIEFARSDLDIPLFLHPYIASVTLEVRDNSMPMNRYYLGDNGRISTERADYFFSDRTDNRIKSREEFETSVRNLLKSDNLNGVEITEVKHKVSNIRTIGYMATFKRGSREGIYAYTGYRFGRYTQYSNDNGQIDTIVHLRYDGDAAGVAAIKEMLTGVTKVKDREQYAADLKKAGA